MYLNFNKFMKNDNIYYIKYYPAILGEKKNIF